MFEPSKIDTVVVYSYFELKLWAFMPFLALHFTTTKKYDSCIACTTFQTHANQPIPHFFPPQCMQHTHTHTTGSMLCICVKMNTSACVVSLYTCCFFFSPCCVTIRKREKKNVGRAIFPSPLDCLGDFLPVARLFFDIFIGSASMLLAISIVENYETPNKSLYSNAGNFSHLF